MRALHSSSLLEHSSQLFLCCVNSLACVRASASIAFRLCLSPSYPNSNHVQLKARPIAASARLYCAGGQLLEARVSGPCRACLVLHLYQLVPYAALGLGRDGANNLASSRLESWALDDSSVEKTPYSVLDSTKRPHKYRDIECSAKYLNTSVRGVLEISTKLAIMYAVAIRLVICIMYVI